MAATFVAASSRFLQSTNLPVIAAPFTISAWFNFPTSASDRTIWSLENAADTNGWIITKLSTDLMVFGAFDGGGYVEASVSGTITSNAWHFVVAREISSANRRITLLRPDGSVTHAQNTSSKSPTGLAHERIGAWGGTSSSGYADGRIAEFTKWNIDIQPDGAQLQDALLRQIAYGGPFSLTHAVANIVEYRSFFSGFGSDQDQGTEVYHSRFGRQTWANNNGVSLGPHVPLPYWYAKPGQTQRALVV